MLAVQNRLIALLPEAWTEYRDRGLLHAELGDTASAVEDLETYLARASQEMDRHAIADRLTDLRGTHRG